MGAFRVQYNYRHRLWILSVQFVLYRHKEQMNETTDWRIHQGSEWDFVFLCVCASTKIKILIMCPYLKKK